MNDVATRRFVLAIVTIAALSVAVVAYIAPGFEESSLSVAAFFGLLGILAHSFAYTRPSGSSGNISFIPFLSAVGLAPTFPVVLSVCLAVTCAEVLKRKPPLQAAFNVAQAAIAISFAIIIYRVMGGVPIGSTASLSLVPFTVAFLTALVVNTLAVSGVLAISRNERFLRVWRQTTEGVIVYDLFAIPVVYGFAYVYHGSPAWALGIVLPIFGLRQLYKTNWQLETINQELLQLMVAAIEARDPYTSGHSQRVAEYSRIVSRAAGLSSRETERVYTAALLHDVGKIHEEFAVILRKPGRLTEAEYGVMQGHSEKGAILVGKVTQFRDIVPAIRGHHEAWDGSGYPDERKAEEIPIGARIIAFADTIDAMTTDRPYREALDADAVRTELVSQAGRQFDPRIAVQLVSERHWTLVADAIRSHRTMRRMTPRSIEAMPRHSVNTRPRIAAI